MREERGQIIRSIFQYLFFFFFILLYFLEIKGSRYIIHIQRIFLFFFFREKGVNYWNILSRSTFFFIFGLFNASSFFFIFISFFEENKSTKVYEEEIIGSRNATLNNKFLNIFKRSKFIIFNLSANINNSFKKKILKLNYEESNWRRRGTVCATKFSSSSSILEDFTEGFNFVYFPGRRNRIVSLRHEKRNETKFFDSIINVPPSSRPLLIPFPWFNNTRRAERETFFKFPLNIIFREF